jgi:putative transposase
VIFPWISKNKCHWPVRVMCHVLHVSSSGYYKWCRNTPCCQMAAQEVALVEIKAIHAEVKERYGSPRIHQELKKRGFKTSLNTVAKIMRKNHIRTKFSRIFNWLFAQQLGH